MNRTETREKVFELMINSNSTKEFRQKIKKEFPNSLYLVIPFGRFGTFVWVQSHNK